MKRLIFVGVTVFLAVLVVSFPARVAYDWFAPDALQLAGISGSIWSGSAAEAKAGDAYIRNISWTFSPAALLTGKLAFRTTSHPASGTMQAVVAVSSSGNLILTDLNGNLPLDLLHPALQQEGIRGDLSLRFDSIVMRNGVPVAADGMVRVSDFFVPELSASQLGDFRAEFQTDEDTIVGSVEDESAVLDVAGTININPDRSFSFIGLVAPTPMTPTSVVNQLRYLGTPNARGQHEFRFEGQL